MHTIRDLLARLADDTEHGLACWDRNGHVRTQRSYAEVVARARRTGRALAERGLRRGSLVFLQLSTSHELIEAHLGALAIGAVPCILAPPRSLGGLDAFTERVARLREVFPGAPVVVEPSLGAELGSASNAGVWLPVGEDELGAECDLAGARPADLAFVQLTSGSTRAPKAVQITHGALMHNAAAMVDAVRLRPDDTMVGWLPLYHDMGLVGVVFGAIAGGANVWLMRPELFVARPWIWLKAFAEIDAEGTATAPTFGYRHCVERVPDAELDRIDLSRWRVAGCGAERVRPDVMGAFEERFGPRGFRRGSWAPCYGMAEATLVVSFHRDGDPVVVDGHVGCGHAVLDTEIVVRDPAGRPLADGEQGEITVRSPALCGGYLGGDAPSPVRDGWLHTGDRGFLRDGQVFITGRFKDLIIIDGVNVDPDEIEWIADRVVATPGARNAAFGVDVDGRERPVLVCETSPTATSEQLAAWSAAIGERVAEVLGFALHELVFVRRGSLPKTSSGKIQRGRVRSAHEAGELELVAG